MGRDVGFSHPCQRARSLRVMKSVESGRMLVADAPCTVQILTGRAGADRIRRRLEKDDEHTAPHRSMWRSSELSDVTSCTAASTRLPRKRRSAMCDRGRRNDSAIAPCSLGRGTSETLSAGGARCTWLSPKRSTRRRSHWTAGCRPRRAAGARSRYRPTADQDRRTRAGQRVRQIACLRAS